MLLHSSTNVNYNIYDTDNDIRSQKELKFNTSLNSQHSYNDLVIKPSLTLGMWDMNDKLSNNGNNEFYQTAAGLGLNIPSKKITSSLRIGKNKSTRDVGDNLDKMFASFDAYKKVGKLNPFKNVLLYCKAYLNDYEYTTNTNSYRETSLTLGMKMSF